MKPSAELRGAVNAHFDDRRNREIAYALCLAPRPPPTDRLHMCVSVCDVPALVVEVEDMRSRESRLAIPYLLTFLDLRRERADGRNAMPSSAELVVLPVVGISCHAASSTALQTIREYSRQPPNAPLELRSFDLLCFCKAQVVAFDRQLLTLAVWR